MEHKDILCGKLNTLVEIPLPSIECKVEVRRNYNMREEIGLDEVLRISALYHEKTVPKTPLEISLLRLLKRVRLLRPEDNIMLKYQLGHVRSEYTELYLRPPYSLKDLVEYCASNFGIALSGQPKKRAAQKNYICRLEETAVLYTEQSILILQI